MNKKNNFLSKGVLFLLLSFLIGCSTTVKKQVDPLVKINNHETLKSEISALIPKDASLKKLVYINELKNISIFLDGYFNYLNDLMSEENIKETKKYIQLYGPPQNLTVFTNSNLEFINFSTYLDMTIPNVLASNVKEDMNRNKEVILGVIFYREFVIEEIDTFTNDSKQKIILNNMFIKNRGFMELWRKANNITNKDFKKFNKKYSIKIKKALNRNIKELSEQKLLNIPYRLYEIEIIENLK